MKIYSSPISPFGSRVAIAARAKGIDPEWPPLPSGGLKSAEYLALNPIAKIPVLVTGDGVVIPESGVILDYLEDRYPEPSLRPETPEDRARMNTLVRIMDAYVMDPVIRCFPHLDPAQRNNGVVAGEHVRWAAGLVALEHFFQEALPEAPAGLTLADCALPPSLHLVRRVSRNLGLAGDPLEPHPELAAYFERMAAHPLVGPVLDALTRAQTAYDEARASRQQPD